jgi:hypothetical protein
MRLTGYIAVTNKSGADGCSIEEKTMHKAASCLTICFRMILAAKVEELCLLLNDIHVRLEMLKEIAATDPSPEFDWLLEEIKMQEVAVLAKLARLGVKI